MKQINSRIKIAKKKKTTKKQRKKPLFGTSKLEDDFAKDFLDKLGIKYIYQFEAKEIKRYYDFACFIDGNPNNLSVGNILIIEVDGSYFHADPRVISEENLLPMHKKNKAVDEIKNRWAFEHGIPLMRIWEKDIRDNPKKVMKDLKDRFYIEDKKKMLLENKKKRHVNKIK